MKVRVMWYAVLAVAFLTACTGSPPKATGPVSLATSSGRVEFDFPAGWFPNPSNHPFDLQVLSEREQANTGVFEWTSVNVDGNYRPRELLEIQISDMRSQRENFEVFEEESVIRAEGKTLTSIVYSGENQSGPFLYAYTLITFEADPALAVVALQVVLPEKWQQFKPVLKSITASARTRVSRVSASADDSDVFFSPTLGLSITKLPAWNFFTAEQNRENLERVLLKDEELQALVAKYSTTPLVLIARHQEPFDDLNPSLKVNARPTGQLEGKSGSEILSLISGSFKDTFQDFAVLQHPTDTKVGGQPAGYMSMNYSLAIPDGRTFPTTSELWIVPRGSYFLLIGAGTRQDEKTGSRADINAMLNSISFGSP